MIPLKDDNPRIRVPFITVALIIANVIVFYFEIKTNYEPVLAYGAVPSRIMNGQNLHTLFTSMFLHGSFLHLGGNMLYLWIFGDNIEGYLGHGRFLFFYLLCGLLAAGAHIGSDVFVGSTSDVPMVGASGAISGVLGAYLVKYPKARVLVLIPIFFFLTIRKIPAYFVLGFWFVIQLFSGLSSLGFIEKGGVAFWAHVGGFVAGVLLVNLFQSKPPRAKMYYA